MKIELDITQSEMVELLSIKKFVEIYTRFLFNGSNRSEIELELRSLSKKFEGEKISFIKHIRQHSVKYYDFIKTWCEKNGVDLVLYGDENVISLKTAKEFVEQFK